MIVGDLMLIDGQPISSGSDPVEILKCLQRGWSFGDGLFETITFNNGESAFWLLHMQRLQAACQRLLFECPGLDELYEQSKLLAKQMHCVIRITLIRSGGQGYYPGVNQSLSKVHTVVEVREPPAVRKDLRLGIADMVLTSQPALAGVKHISRLEQVLLAAEQESKKEQFDDLLVCDNKGYIVEAISSNLLVYVPNRGWLTPDLSKAGVTGVMREWLLRQGKVQTARVSQTVLTDAVAMALINAVRGLEVVSTLNDVKLTQVHHCLSLQKEIHQVIGIE